ncbi:MAG TPA: nuclear transport factor 2 family protein [Thermoanaerobaculia bacterium]|jgi:ketosteroid isomerase-like protein|nr:nuclear transport factor 2 family protein [Thermoanaerobaculia bacterium]
MNPLRPATILTATLVTALAALPVPAQTIDRQAALDGMVAAEHAFAKMAKEKGTRAAFLANLAEDSLLFGPDLTSGPALWKNRPDSPSLLSWYPTFADISLAGDLGYTTGPWEFRSKRDAREADAYGYFVTLWKKQRDGSWKAMFDQGSSNPKPAGPIKPAIPPARPAKVEASALPKVEEGAERALLETDRAFAGVSEAKGDVAAYLGVLAEDARLYRVGHEPIVGRKAIHAALAENPAPMTWAPAGAIVSRSGDLGYTFGLAKRRQSGPESPWVDSDNYLRIWKKQAGAWKLVLDVFDPRPPKSPEGPQKPKEPANE